ncbi:MAG: hypothetical protein NTV45_09060, partial [Firmicutes bacterium]|nr:hypothetical protein [Bacillota bacterium]
MGKRSRLGTMIIISVLCCLVIVLGPASATSLIPPLDTNTNLQPGTEINIEPIVPHIQRTIPDLLFSYPTIQYPQGGELIKVNQPCLLEFSINKQPEEFAIESNTRHSGYSQHWFGPLEKSIVIKGNGSSYAVLWMHSDDDYMDNSAIIRVIAFWDAKDWTNKTETDSEVFSLLDWWDRSVKAVPGDNKVSLSWDPVSAAPDKVTYSILRRIAGGEWKSITDFPIKEA